jgi:hypothetical protein
MDIKDTTDIIVTAEFAVPGCTSQITIVRRFNQELIGALFFEGNMSFLQYILYSVKKTSACEKRALNMLLLSGGYCLALDMTARDFQNEAKRGGLPWTMAKVFKL